MFPGFRLSLPPKRWFKDNYDSDFLEDRQLGLQAFMQNLVAHKDIANWYVTVLRCFFFFFFILKHSYLAHLCKLCALKRSHMPRLPVQVFLLLILLLLLCAGWSVQEQ